MRRLRGTVVLIGVLTACSGGGGQRAQNQGDQTTTSTSGAVTTSTIPPASVDSTSTSGTAVTAPPSTTTGAGAALRPIRTDRLKGPRSASPTARTLARVERGLRGSNRDPAYLRSLGRAQQLAYRSLVAHPDWLQKVLAAVPADLRAAVQANYDGGSNLGGLTGSAPAGFPNWTIRAPKPAPILRAYYAEAERAYGVSWAYLAAIHFVETRLGRIHGNSNAGAQGPMQFIPTTWAAYGKGDINDDHDAILAAAHYLQANNASTDIDHAIYRYNNDQRYVAAIKAYASVMLADSGAYDGYYQWQVFYATTDGAFLLPEGWSASGGG